MSEKRKIIGLCGGLSPDGIQNNAIAVSILEHEFNFYRTSPLDVIYNFSKAIGVLNDNLSENEERIVINKVCISGRTADSNMWINMALKNVPSDKMLILVDDMHFIEEAETVKRLGGTIIKIDFQDKNSIIPLFSPDVIIMGNTKEEKINAFKHAVKTIMNAG